MLDPKSSLRSLGVLVSLASFTPSLTFGSPVVDDAVVRASIAGLPESATALFGLIGVYLLLLRKGGS